MDLCGLNVDLFHVENYKIWQNHKMISGYWENPTMNNADVLTGFSYRIKNDKS